MRPPPGCRGGCRLARRAPAQALDLGRRVRAGADAVRGGRADRPGAAAWWAVWDGGARSRERSLRRAGSSVTPSRVLVPRRARPRRSATRRRSRSSRRTARSTSGRASAAACACAARRSGREVDARGLVDESAGYHARRTAWLWSAGVGVLASGEPVAWNLVDGLHDAADGSERTVWIDGEPRTSRRSRSTGSTASAACASPREARAPQGEPARADALRLRAAVRHVRRRAPRRRARCARAGA